MANLKYSRQRASIKEYLAGTVEHPTADTVYMHVREEFPNISLGTVYRNLNLLADIGEAVKITTFDGRTEPHYHVVCGSCGKVEDLEMSSEEIASINNAADSVFDGKITSHTTLFYGTCKECLEKEK